MKTSIVIATYGSDDWARLGDTRAMSSAADQHAHEIIRIHQPDGTVASCRNQGAADATGDWLVFLDADDELAPGYLAAMRQIEGQPNYLGGGPPLLFTPAVSYHHGRRLRAPKFWPEVDLRWGNWLVIGTAVRRDLFFEVGGFVEGEPHGLEDFSLWQRCWKAGAVVVKVPKAIYIAHRNGQSKHAALARDRKTYMDEYHAVIKRNFPELFDERGRPIQ